MEKPLLPSTNRAASPERLLHAPHLSCAHFERCSYPLPLRLLLPDSEPSAETSTTSSTTSSSSATSSSSTASSAATSSGEESMPEEPANSVAAEPETQAQAAVAEPELLYCDPGNLTILGTFSDGTQRPTDLCDTPAHRRAARAEGVCGNPAADTNFLRNMQSCAIMIRPSTSLMGRTGQIHRTSRFLVTIRLRPLPFPALLNLNRPNTKGQLPSA